MPNDLHLYPAYPPPTAPHRIASHRILSDLRPATTSTPHPSRRACASAAASACALVPPAAEQHLRAELRGLGRGRATGDLGDLGDPGDPGDPGAQRAAREESTTI
ncbi:hypothetical protein JHW43_009548 [Diplocarpon mali]|nr:hypothetical protein JHW43_009548 [Diplocarpon mali]